ncbi:MAG: FkbM family methyltransferase [Alphaproteobacteria bacterium]|nr:FkbM family methyltransferase [Alphaproteobacteria bacterium]
MDTLDTAATPEMTRGRTLLKMDVQGFELEVLKRAVATLGQIEAIYLEAGFVLPYATQPLATELIVWLDRHGFGLAAIYNVDSGAGTTPSQADCLFLRKHEIEGARA